MLIKSVVQFILLLVVVPGTDDATCTFVQVDSLFFSPYVPSMQLPACLECVERHGCTRVAVAAFLEAR